MDYKNKPRLIMADALEVLAVIVQEHPGLLDDSEVNGADLVDTLSRLIDDDSDLNKYLRDLCKNRYRL